MINTFYDIIIVGGGAAGFFTAINIAEKNPSVSICILEKSKSYLDKVRISGGGRCNVTHACWEPKELTNFYPRGNKELLGPFHQWMCGDMLDWLDKHGVETKIESDGRIFPSSNKSETIIECFLGQAQKLKVELRLSEGLRDFVHEGDAFKIESTTGKNYECKNLVLATGGSKSIWSLLEGKGINIVPPVPSLFTFKIESPLIADLPGLSVEKARIKIAGFKMETTGPVLITHWGLSGPGILKLSSWAARFLHEKNYNFQVSVNWVNKDTDIVEEEISFFRTQEGSKNVLFHNPFKIPKRLWKKMINYAEIGNKNWADLSKKNLQKLIQILTNCHFTANGKTTNKEEFVTSGGIALNQVNFKKMNIKSIPNLYVAGELLNIDALTGGFNFQAAWTTSWIISENFTIN